MLLPDLTSCFRQDQNGLEMKLNLTFLTYVLKGKLPQPSLLDLLEVQYRINMAELGYYVVPSRGTGDAGKPLILLSDRYITHADQSRVTTRLKKTNTVQYFKGTLLREVETTKDVLEKNKILCRNPESEVYFQCSKKDVKEISESVYDLLLAIPNCRDRLEIANNALRQAEGLEMDVDTQVFVKLPNHTGEYHGIIRYKGEIHDKEGIHFGIELYNAEGRGNTNGTYGKQRYFHCDSDAGIFLPLNRVRPHQIESARNHSHSYSPISTRRNKQSRLSGTASSSQSRNSAPETAPYVRGVTKEELDSLGIRHGMEVFIFTEVRGQESQEKGKVKFIGRLPGGNSGQGIYVGIDLDRDVGNGTGLYNGKHLFYTRQNHAALVPLSGVLPAYVADTAPSPSRDISHKDTDALSRETGRRSSRHSSSNHRSRNDVTPQMQKTFVQSSRFAHSSPSVLGGNGRLEAIAVSEFGSSYPHSSRRSPRHSPRDSPLNQDLYESESIDRHNYQTSIKAGTQVKNQRVVATPRPALHRGLSDNNSDEEMPDLYGSDNSIAVTRLSDRKDGILRPSSPTMTNLYRPGRDLNSLPGFPPTPMPNSLKPRSTKTAPGAMRTNGLAELVDYNSINQEYLNTENAEQGMEVGTMVEVTNEVLGSDPKPGPTYGVIKWIGELPDHEKELAVGVELEQPLPNGTDGTFNGVRYFSCDYGRGHFVYLKFCKKDSRFSIPDAGATGSSAILPSSATRDFGNFDSPQIPGAVSPPIKLDRDMIGKKRGIQGHHNSCYLDSTLFSLFAYSQVLDTILFRRRRPTDLPEYEEAQKVLKELIINPLRIHHFVRADRIMQLRELLDKLGSVSGLVNEEKDPEEFLNTLLLQVFKAEPLHELRQGDSNAAHEGYFYQIFMDRDEKMGIPSTQQLLEKSLISADLKFRNVPVCLIIQMPRFGKEYKMFKKLRPSLQLDITNLVEDIPRSCDVCEEYAEYECRDCFLSGSLEDPVFSYCKLCADRLHSHRKRKNHCFRAIKVPDRFREYATEAIRNNEEPRVDRQTLELFAVVCIATSHYVSFAKCGSGKNAEWVFFDSMADRVGEQSGYNIPEITHCPDFVAWLSQDERSIQSEDEKLMPELKRRLLCDAYMCMYQSTDLMFYK
ncbi:ubiquitin carboxyl-terminal hydrolase CYLD-like [Styela clava]